MPELPDVESFKRYFQKTSLNKKVIGIEGRIKKENGKNGVKKQGQNRVNSIFWSKDRPILFSVTQTKS